jgi:hypothetical protein
MYLAKRKPGTLWLLNNGYWLLSLADRYAPDATRSFFFSPRMRTGTALSYRVHRGKFILGRL